MTVIQVNIFICDKCGATETHTEETSWYSDPVVTPPDGWIDNECGDICPKCRKIKEANP